jgi:endonuclease/exonuclease/phosphatase family metal-dependent hydrolase
MAKTLKVLSWNIQNWGGPARNYQKLDDFIVRAIDMWGADIVGIMEVRANRGAALGQYLCQQLDALNLGQAWAFSASGQLGGRREQYLFLWNTNVVTGSNFFPTLADVTNKTVYADTANMAVGFPQFGQATSAVYPYASRPPFRGEFKELTTNKTLPIYLFHADSAYVAARDGAKAIARVREIVNGARGLVMGDFNITPSDLNSQHGANSFNDLATTRGYSQKFTANEKTSLKKYQSAVANMTAADCLLEPYDNFFLKLGGFTASAPAVGNLIADCVTPQQMATHLGDYVKQRLNLQARPGYPDVTSAFSHFAHYVSDHLPIVIDIKFQ